MADEQDPDHSFDNPPMISLDIFFETIPTYLESAPLLKHIEGIKSTVSRFDHGPAVYRCILCVNHTEILFYLSYR